MERKKKNFISRLKLVSLANTLTGHTNSYAIDSIITISEVNNEENNNDSTIRTIVMQAAEAENKWKRNDKSGQRDFQGANLRAKCDNNCLPVSFSTRMFIFAKRGNSENLSYFTVFFFPLLPSQGTEYGDLFQIQRNVS